jgi:hypothetical protein
MADPAFEEGSQSGVDFLDRSTLRYLIPASTNFDIEQAFNNEATKAPSDRFDSIETRESLFFGEPAIPHPFSLTIHAMLITYLFLEPR